MLKLKRSNPLLKTIAILVTSFVLALSIIPQAANAAPTKIADMTPEASAKAFVFYKALRVCMQTPNNYKNKAEGGVSMSAQNAINLDWFYDGEGNLGLVIVETNVGIYGDDRSGGDGRSRCGSAEGRKLIQNLMSATGYTSGAQLLCDIGFTRQVNVAGQCATVSGSDNNFNAPGNSGEALDAWWRNFLGASDLGPGSIGPGEYELYLRSFEEGCSAVPGSGDKQFTIKIATEDGKGVKDGTYAIEDRNKSGDTTFRLYGTNDVSCKNLAALIDNIDDRAVKAYLEYLRTGGAPIGPPDGAVDDPDAETTSCVIEGVGWFVCAGANFLASITDGLYGIIENIIRVPAINTDTSSGGNGVYNTWVIVRNFANILFVIAFIIIIFSQLTGVGITNYGVKKTLPRLVIAAILVNVSFWISALAVDISNLLGAGIYEILAEVKGRMNINMGSNWGAMVTALLAGQAIGTAAAATAAGATIAVVAVASTGPTGIIALIALALPMVLAAVLAVLVMIFVLVARQALIVILIVISPLAFVAMLLPNTEKLFTKWRQLLTSLLLLYPIVSLIFVGSQIAGLITIAGSNSSNGDPIAGGVAIIAGQLMMVAPFFFIPFILTKFSGGNLDSVARQISSRGKSLISGISGASRKFGVAGAKRSFGMMKAGRGRGFGGAIGGSIGNMVDRYSDKNALIDNELKRNRQNRLRDTLRTDPKFVSDVAGGDAVRAAEITENAIASHEAEELKEALQTLTRSLSNHKAQGGDGDQFLRDRIHHGASPSERSAAMNLAASTGRDEVLRGASNGYTDNQGTFHPPAAGADREALQRAIDSNASSLGSKAPDLVKGPKAFTSFSGTDMSKWSAGTAKAFMQHIERMQGSGNTQAAQEALDSFARASKDIQSNTNLQSDFSSDVGVAIQQEAARIATATPSLGALPGAFSSIGSDGKIR